MIITWTYAVPTELPWKDWAGKNVMFISAHPDDIEYCSAALIQYLTQELSPPANVSYIILTNGNAGGHCVANYTYNGESSTQCSAMQLAAEREKEAQNAAAYLGVNPDYVQILDYDDSMLKSYPEQDIRENLVIVVRTYKPSIVITFYPYIGMLISILVVMIISYWDGCSTIHRFFGTNEWWISRRIWRFGISS